MAGMYVGGTAGRAPLRSAQACWQKEKMDTAVQCCNRSYYNVLQSVSGFNSPHVRVAVPRRRRAATIASAGRPAARGSDQLARPAPIPDDPAGIIPYSHWAARPSAHLHPNRSSLDVSPHVPTPPTMACTIGPLALSARTATVLAHGPVLGPRCRIATQAAPQRLQLAPPAPFCTLGSAAPLLHSPAPLYA